jgi:hypothetical protein
VDALGLLCPQNYATIVVGGGGGGPFTMNCPSGKVLSGFRGRSGARLDQIQIYCSNTDGTNSALEMATAGGGGGGPYDENCPADSVLVELRGRSGTRVDGIQPICQNID